MRCRLFLLLMAAVFVAGCGNRSRHGVVPPRKFAAFLYDFHMAQAVGGDLKAEDRYMQKLYVNYVFEKHGISREEYDTSLVWYTRHPEELYKIYVSLSERTDEEKELLSASLEKIERRSFDVESGDTVDIWYLERNRLMTSAPLMNPLAFSITVDTTFYRSDSLQWRVGIMFNGIIRDSMAVNEAGAYLSLSLAYKDSISSTDTIAVKDGVYVLNLKCDETAVPDKVFGSITYLDSDSCANPFVLLHDMSLVRFHEQSHVSDSLSAVADSLVTDSLTTDSLESDSVPSSEF